MTEDRGRILILGGTSEGRELAEYAAANGVRVLISVVSEYGEQLLEESDWVQVRCGRLDEDAMERLLRTRRPPLVLDATHPYAKEVTEQAKKLCAGLSIPYRRVLRSAAEYDYCQQEICRVASAEAAAALLLKEEGRILLTTGSKELEVFAGEERLRERIYVRVLPDSRVIAACERLGVRGTHLIAMQGPFSMELNCALLHQTEARWLVTKESGDRGGFAEKLEAAGLCGVSVILIKRPLQEQGISVEAAGNLMQAFQAAAGGMQPEMMVPELRTPEAERSLREARSEQKHQAEGLVCLIGMGMGGGSQMTLEALDALKQCDAVLGAPRMLESIRPWTEGKRQEPIYLAEPVQNWLRLHPEYRRVAVVYSGDTGFYSGAASLLEMLNGRQVRVYPGISSVSSLAARMQVGWEHMHLASAHGRSCDIIRLVQKHERVFLLLGGEETLVSLCDKLTDAGLGTAVVTAGIRMGYPDEEVLVDSAEALAKRLRGEPCKTLAAVVIERTKSDAG